MISLHRAVNRRDCASGAAYLLDFLQRGEVGALNPVEKTVHCALAANNLLPDKSARELLSRHFNMRTRLLLSETPGLGPLLNRTGLRPDNVIVPLDGPGAPADVLYAASSPLDDIKDIIDQAKEGADAVKEGAKAAKDIGDAAKTTKELFDRIRELAESGGEDSKPPVPGQPPIEGPLQVPELVPSQFLESSQTKPGYCVAIDEVICHEEIETPFNDFIVWGCRAWIVLNGGSVLLCTTTAAREYEMNGRDSGKTYVCQHPGIVPVRAGNRIVRPIQYDTEAYLMHHYGGLRISIPRTDFKKLVAVISIIESESLESTTLENLGKLVASGISIGRAVKDSQPVPGNLLDSLAQAVSTFIGALLSFFAEDRFVLAPLQIEITKSDIDSAPPLKPTDTSLPLSGVPWIREPRHDRIRDVEPDGLKKGLILHGYRNDETMDEEDESGSYEEAVFKAQLAGADPLKGVAGEVGSWWYELRLRYELTVP